MLKSFSKYYYFAIAFLGLIFFIFRSLILNINSNLLDWLDYPLMVWIIFQNAGHLKSLQFDGIFNSNIFYPFEGTLLFSDLLMPQSLLAIPLTFFTQNVILIFNLIFFLTLILNVISVTFFWKKFISNISILFLAVLMTAFSPYFFLNFGHFQMINFWPLFFGLSILFDKKLTFQKTALIAFFCTLQILTSVYLCVFMLFAIGLWFGLNFIFEIRNKSKIIDLIKKFILFCLVFSILSSVFVYKYLQVKNAYGIVRGYGEYVLYAAHLSDYVFDTHYHSLLGSFSPVSDWDKFNHHTIGEAAGFPGFTLLGLSISGLLISGFKKDKFNLKTYLNFNELYFLVLTVCGFIFSLGPRFNFNGVYLGYILPYALLLKLIPLFEPIRATARWSFFFYFGLAYFAIIAFEKLNKKFDLKILIIALSVFYIVEIVPVDKQTEAKNYYPDVYNFVNQNCINPQSVLLEYPLTQDSKDANIINNLTYKTQMMLASLHHSCDLINGYTGFTPKDYERYESDLSVVISQKNEKIFDELLEQRNVTLFKLNKDFLYPEKSKIVGEFLTDQNFKVLLNNDQYIIAEVLN